MATAELPPVPDPQTGQPRPPRAPTVSYRGGGDSETDERYKPDPPPGQGPVLEWYRGSWRDSRFAYILFTVLMLVFFTIPLGFSWVHYWYIWPLILLPGPFFAWVARRKLIYAGSNWLADRVSWVKTYELVEAKMIPGGIKHDLLLRDSDDRSIIVSLPTLQIKPELWALVYNGVLHSAHTREVKTNKLTRRALHLPPYPPPTSEQRGETSLLDRLPPLPTSHRRGRRRSD